MVYYLCSVEVVVFFFSSRRRHTRCALVTGVQTCALPICDEGALEHAVQLPAQRAGLARRGPGMLDLAEDLRLAQYQRVEPGGDPEQMPHRVAVPVVVEVGVQGLPGAGFGVASRARVRRQAGGTRLADAVGKDGKIVG